MSYQVLLLTLRIYSQPYSLLTTQPLLSKSITGLGKFTEYEFHGLAFTVNGYRPVSPVKLVRTSEDGKTIPFVNWKV